jgi:trans-2,3-dihydro-3-hydroxyanthranilate isomerase
MSEHEFMQVDAFTTKPLEGNPCAIVFDSDDLSDDTMLAIAREMNLSETSFVCKSTIADFRARYFTPAEEVPLAGHPTIATAFALVQSGRLKITSDHVTIHLELQVGAIPVEIFSRQGKISKIVMSQKRPQFLRSYPPELIAPVFGLDENDLLTGAVVQTVSTGTPQLMIPVQHVDVLRKANILPDLYNALKAQGDFFSPHLFCLQANNGRTFARHFGVPPDLREDPFTGSATGGMAAYLWHYHLLETPSFVAEQGHWMQRPGTASVEVIGPRDNIETVKVGGPAASVMHGKLVF